MTDLSELIERVRGWLTRKMPDFTGLVWRVQCAGHPLSDDPCEAFYHIARSPIGTFEIFETGGLFLLHFPRRTRLPAELFSELSEAKSRAITALQSQDTDHDQ